MQYLRTTPSSGLEDKSQDSIQSILDNLDTLESDDDFEDEWDRVIYSHRLAQKMTLEKA